jgi:CxxC-x17-CxxC domain-containing protein
MYQGNWKCSKCGGAITELPFQPRSEAGLTCRTCYAKSKDPNGGGSNSGGFKGAPADTSALGASTYDDRDVPDFADFDSPSSGPMEDDGFGAMGATPAKPRTEGNWTCSSCGGAITSLPFTPRDTSNLKCLDCFKRSKA